MAGQARSPSVLTEHISSIYVDVRQVICTCSIVYYQETKSYKGLVVRHVGVVKFQPLSEA